ncbi:hypothetical protein HPB50_028001 [Hyalomma asiaticum]|nr:hypothetical protein HPB50_028001 [Hyalomma asiaticum]
MAIPAFAEDIIFDRVAHSGPGGFVPGNGVIASSRSATIPKRGGPRKLTLGYVVVVQIGVADIWKRNRRLEMQLERRALGLAIGLCGDNTAGFSETIHVHADLEFQNSLTDQRWMTAVTAGVVELGPILSLFISSHIT